MTRARPERVERDPARAKLLLRQASEHLASAHVAGVSAESAFALCYQAMLKAMVGALLAQGVRVTSGLAGHVVIIREASHLLDLDPQLVSRIDAMRRARNQLFYDVDEVTESQLSTALSDAKSAIDAAATTIARSDAR